MYQSIRSVVFLLALYFAQPALAGRLVTDIIELRYRTVEEAVATLRPLVPPPGVVTGLSGQLVIRTTPDNLAIVREVLDRLDKAPEQLTIYVRHGGTSSAAGLTADPWARRTGNRNDHQRLTVLEGRDAFIHTSQSFTTPQTTVIVNQGRGTATVVEGTRIQQAKTGFYVRPRLAGQEVLLDIAPQRQQFRRRSGTIESNSASTTVRARLGEWVEIGGVAHDTAQTGALSLSGSQRTTSSSSQIFIMVEEAR